MNVVPPSAGKRGRDEFFEMTEAESKPVKVSKPEQASNFFLSSANSVKASVEALQFSLELADQFGLPLGMYLQVTKWKSHLDLLLKGSNMLQTPLQQAAKRQ